MYKVISFLDLQMIRFTRIGSYDSKNLGDELRQIKRQKKEFQTPEKPPTISRCNSSNYTKKLTFN